MASRFISNLSSYKWLDIKIDKTTIVPKSSDLGNTISIKILPSDYKNHFIVDENGIFDFNTVVELRNIHGNILGEKLSLGKKSMNISQIHDFKTLIDELIKFVDLCVFDMMNEGTIPVDIRMIIFADRHKLCTLGMGIVGLTTKKIEYKVNGYKELISNGKSVLS